MRLYRHLWFALAVAVSLPGAVVGLLGDGVWVSGAVAASIGVTVSGVATSVHQARPRTSSSVSVTVATGGAGAVVCFVVAGLVTLLGPAALLLVLLFAATSPPSLRALARSAQRANRWRRRSTHRHPQGVATTASETVLIASDAGTARSLSDAELLLAWGASADSLDRLQGRQHHPQQLLQLAARRQYLDEFERRHPETFLRWLADGAPSGSAPAGDPSPDERSDDQRRRERP